MHVSTPVTARQDAFGRACRMNLAGHDCTLSTYFIVSPRVVSARPGASAAPLVHRDRVLKLFAEVQLQH